jgi:hypothetical protein
MPSIVDCVLFAALVVNFRAGSTTSKIAVLQHGDAAAQSVTSVALKFWERLA